MTVDAEGRQYHIHCRPGEVGGYVLLPGDPGRVEPIARKLDDAHPVAAHREYVTWTGQLLGESVSVTSTGIGCPSTAIAVEELLAVGAHTFIRVGTSGAMQAEIDIGTLIIGAAAIRDEGTSRQYLPIEFPAAADIEVTTSLIAGATVAGAHWRAGVLHSKDSFYGQVEPQSMPVAPRLAERWEAWRAGGALASEMEAATLFTVAAVRGARAGAICIAAGNAVRPRREDEYEISTDLGLLLDAAIAGLSELITRDRQSGRLPTPRPLM